MYNDKVLNLVQTWLLGFSAMYRFTKFGGIKSPTPRHKSDQRSSLISQAPRLLIGSITRGQS
jgi:hypothetical protein